jgi:Icc-related predicted phosphoesterase
VIGLLRIYFATDIHGSDICWRKFINAGKFYKADLIILGGDTTGKEICPIIRYPNGKTVICFFGRKEILEDEKEIKKFETRIMDAGLYPYYTTSEEYEYLIKDEEKIDGIFSRLMIERWEKWVEIADKNLKGTGIRCLVAPGNDDRFVIDSIIDSSEVIERVEGKVVEIDQYEMINCGWTNPTPWRTPRECSEAELTEKIEAMVSQVKNMENCIFELHAPPYGSGLDEAPILDENLVPIKGGTERGPVGSKAVLQAIRKYNPLLGLHGHIHESKAAIKIGRTLCLNPGSMYSEGILQGALIVLDKGKVKNFFFTSG